LIATLVEADKAPIAFNEIVPALIVVAPVYVLAPVSVRVPVPFFVNAPVPETTPDIADTASVLASTSPPLTA